MQTGKDADAQFSMLARAAPLQEKAFSLLEIAPNLSL